MKQYFIKPEKVIARLRTDLEYLSQAEHPFGSKRQKKVSEWMMKKLKQNHVFLAQHIFTAEVPIRPVNPSLQPMNKPFKKIIGYNVLGKVKGNLPCTIMLGSHYDTKILPNHPYLGANDSGSSSAALFEIIRFFLDHVIKKDKLLLCDLIFVWFDGEESVLDDWHAGEKLYGKRDNTYGSRALAGELQKNKDGNFVLPANMDSNSESIRGVIILDMIGSPNMTITHELNSDLKLRQLMLRGAKILKLDHRISKDKMTIEDDHLAFKKLGIPVINLIDFTNRQHWHKPSDTQDKIDYHSIIDAIKLSIYLVLALSHQ
ncbi:MAG: M28 family peptidase [Proteobacteria bacterium]|nr:M28 family peptidase [Pseudomonadota bacterium]